MNMTEPFSVANNSISGDSSNQDKHVHMKQFIVSALEYNRTKSEVCSRDLSRNLQHLSFGIDLSIFDPHVNIVAEFFVGLHELMSNLESRSALLWNSIAILELACQNRATHNALVHTYHFLPILCKILGDQLIKDKKERLLKLIQELTFGVKITWQEPHIPHLLKTIVRWISSSEQIIVQLSLGVLVNICYKNLPVIYMLKRTVDTKSFLCSLMSLETSINSILVSKLLIILEDENREKYILRFIQISMETIVDFYKENDKSYLKHITDFLIDIKSESQFRAIFLEYKDYTVHIRNLISIINEYFNSGTGDSSSNNHSERMSMIFELLLVLVEFDIPDIHSLYPDLSKIALSWIQTKQVDSQALALLHGVLCSLNGNIQCILQPLTEGLPSILVALASGVAQDEHMSMSTECQRKYTALVHLLRVIISCDEFRNSVLEGLPEDSIRGIFSPLLGMTVYSPQNQTIDTNNFSEEGTMLYINALALVEQLSFYNPVWKIFLSQLLNKRQVPMVMAHALYSGDLETKNIVFNLIKSPNFSSSKVVEAFHEMLPLFKYNNTKSQPCFMNTMCESFPYTVMSYSQEQRLNTIIERLEEAKEQNTMQNVTTSNVIELFEYKMVAMGHAERAAQASLETAGKEVAHLKSQVAQMSIESTRLHHLLLSAQQYQEKMSEKLSQSDENFKQSLTRIGKLKVKYNEVQAKLNLTQSELETKVKEFQTLQEKYQCLINKYEITLNLKTELEAKYNDEITKNCDKNAVIKKMEDKIREYNKNLEEKRNSLLLAEQTVESLKEDIRKNKDDISILQKEYAEKEKKLNETEAELEEYKGKLDWIMQISMRKQVKPQSFS